MKDNSGYLSRNSKATSDKHPSHKGKIRVGGVDYWLAAWVNENERGRYFSLKIEPVDRSDRAVDHGSRGGGMDEMQDDIPF